MCKEILIMLKNVLFYDVFIALIVSLITCFIFSNYYVYIIIGLATAVLNFVLNSAITDYILDNKKNNYKIFMVIGLLLRITIVCVICFLVIDRSEINIFPFLLGYSLHFIAIILHGLKI